MKKKLDFKVLAIMGVVVFSLAVLIAICSTRKGGS